MCSDKPLPMERPTGIGVATFSIATALSRKGHEVHLICRGEKERVERTSGGLLIHTVPHFSRDSTHVVATLLKGQQQTILHTHSTSTFPSVVLAKALRKPTVVHAHGDEPTRLTGRTVIRSLLISMADRVIVTSRDTGRSIIRSHHVPSSKIRLAYNGVDVEKFQKASSVSGTLVGLGLESAEKLLLTIGALEPRKGQLLVLESLPTLLKTWNRLTYVNLGVAYDQKYKQAFVDRASELGVRQQVKLVDRISEEDLVSLINLADICVQPSTREGFGLAIVEEMACERPVIASNIGPMREIIDDGIDGELIEPLNCDELTRRISTLLQDQTRARRLGARGRAKVALRFTWEEAASQIEKVYYELLH